MDEVKISRAIVESYTEDLLEHLELDVAVAGAGPSGMISAYYIAKSGIKVAVFEKGLSVGGGMWGGGMMFSHIAVQEEAVEILEEMGISTRKYDDIYCANSLEAVSKICSRAIDAGAKIFNLINIEDIVIREDRICGLVINWNAVRLSNLHVDPLTVRSKIVIDATGHDAEVCRIFERKMGAKLSTSSGGVIGEKSLWTEVGERELLNNTREVYPGLVVAGMTANTVFGSPRMGPIFGGILLSGRKAAELVIKKLK